MTTVSTEPTKQIIVIRTDLNMRKGKMIAQGAHASLGAVLPYIRTYQDEPNDARRQDCVTTWLAGSFTKICVRVDSEEQLLEIHDKATQAGLITCLIRDAGKTEFNGHTNTHMLRHRPRHQRKPQPHHRTTSTPMTHYRIQHWPDMRGDTPLEWHYYGDTAEEYERGDTIIFSTEWPPNDWERHKSWHEAWMWLSGTADPGDTIEILPTKTGTRDDNYPGRT